MTCTSVPASSKGITCWRNDIRRSSLVVRRSSTLSQRHGSHPLCWISGVEVRARHFSGFFGNDGAILAGIGGIVLPLADIYKEVFYGIRRYAFVIGFPVQSS
ncbi:hypothetical protein BDR04DRAFT_97466 [Suillus decipiens]|nr:hypothetical protein BDR04DRAFT_97466 [Suillus decipiens]